MGSENFNSLEELKSLDQQIDAAVDLEGLKPIFYRLDEIARDNPGDFDLQMAVGDVKQHLVSVGTRLKQSQGAIVRPAAAPSPVAATPPPLTFPPPVPPPMEAGPPAYVEPPRHMEPPPPPPPPPLDAPLSATTVLPIPGVPGPPPTPPPIGPLSSTNVFQMPTATNPTPPPPPPLSSPPPPPTSRPPVNLKRALFTGGSIAVILMVLLFVTLINIARKRNATPPPGTSTDVAVSFTTTPPGASIRVNGEAKCTSDCKLSLPPGNYEITAFLDGYEPAASGVVVNAGAPAAMNLILEPQAQSVRILTDLTQGKAILDDQPPADMQEGQFVFEKVAPGPHTVKVTGPGTEVSFGFELAGAKMPAINGTLATKNIQAVLVASFANQAHVVTSSGPFKLTVNGMPEEDAGPAGVDLKSFQAGPDELVIGDGKDQRKLSETFGPAPMLTAFLKTDQNTGTLLVVTGEDDVHVFVNSKEWKRTTQKGQVRIPMAAGPVAVRVVKDGFDASPAQVSEVKKGGDLKLTFTLKAQPKFASLLVQGAASGTEVVIDQAPVGTVGGDGTFRHGSIAPGEHTVELRRPQFVPKQATHPFAAGQTVTISGSDAVLVAASAPAAPAPPPPSAPKAEPPPRVAAVPSGPKVFAMEGWENPGAWSDQDGVYRHKGEAFLAYKVPANGIFVFNMYLIRGGSLVSKGHLRWAVNYIDAKNYALFDMDPDNLSVKDVVNGKTTERVKVKHNVESKQKVWALQVDVSPDHIVQKIQKDDQWVTLYTWVQPNRNFTEGKFGFLVQGNDEIGISDFKFTSR